jgi:GDPmannose 4,6-dehydratase
MVRRASTENFERINHLIHHIHLKQADFLDQLSLISILEESQPDEVYNLAAQSFVPTSWVQPVLTAEFTALGVTRLLKAIRLVNRKIKFYQASSGEMFGKAQVLPQNEQTPFHPRSPYGVAKAYGHYITVNYRESFGIYACSDILFNHESPRRGRDFVSRKITEGAAKIKLGLSKTLLMGNLDARGDWGYAGDYVKAIWLMMQQGEPYDYVIATGISHSVRDLLQLAFKYLDLNFEKYVVVDPKLFRTAEVDNLLGDSTKAQKELGWKAEMSFQKMIQMMMEADLDKLRKQH